MNMQNDLKSKAKASLISSSTYLTNTFDVSGITMHDAAIHRYFGQETLVTVVATL